MDKEQQIEEVSETYKDIKEELEIGTERFLKNMKNVLEIEKRQAVKEFAEKLKRKAFDKDMFNDWKGATYVVLVREIDKLLKEYEKCDK